MNELFESKSQPFYKFGDAIYLQKIPTPDWVEYISQRFSATGKSISAELAEKIVTTVNNHSSYVQQLSWLTWIQTTEAATIDSFNEAYQDLLQQNQALFEKQTESLTANQLNFLRAIIDGVTSEFSSKAVIDKYQLGTSAGIAVIKRALINKELIEIENRRPVIADPVLALWLRTIL
jgi:hypothetical protein